ncbi:Hypothetical predicted protein [Paramuricea clavata]|uniref:Uncharacterized protein n=1 Tax=Paramuricea clavata TaxID=317549 RepID=A0A7D9LCM7_PARCT|nr:Hypothetical predicted protein [Paramuricea clavata]
MDVDDEYESEPLASSFSAFEGDFEQTIVLLWMDVDEVQIEIQQSLEEVEGKKQFPCNFYEKVCKSKGGLTNHQRSKHVAELGERSSSSEDLIISTEKIAGLIRDISRHLIDEKLYKEEHTSEEELSLSPQEFGPLSYLTGYVIRSLYQKSKNCSRCDSPRNKEMQALMSSMREETEANEYIASLSRGGLWSPHSWIDIVNKYKLSHGTQRKKALRKELKIASELK